MSCSKNCGRQALDSGGACCTKCERSEGQDHGPLCDAKSMALKDGKLPDKFAWQVCLSGDWTKLTNDKENERIITEAEAAGEDSVVIHARGFPYEIDFVGLQQRNQRTGRSLPIRVAPSEEDWQPQVLAPRNPRLQVLVKRLLSKSVQVVAAGTIAKDKEEPQRLLAEEVEALFKEQVPGCEFFLFRGMAGQYALPFLIDAYFDGIPAFNGTALGTHMLSLVRKVVHFGYDKGPQAVRHLRDMAEAFMDCQAVQGRVVERIVLEIENVTSDFRGFVTKLIGSQKEMALKELAIEHVRQGLAGDDWNNPAHYESRLLIDLGDSLGLNADAIRLCQLDKHSRRFQPLVGESAQSAAARCRDLFDMSALLKSLVAELGSFSTQSPPESMACQFVQQWVPQNLVDPHVIFGKDLTHVEVNEVFALACLEQLYMGKPNAVSEDQFHGVSIIKLFKPTPPQLRKPKWHKVKQITPQSSGLNLMLKVVKSEEDTSVVVKTWEVTGGDTSGVVKLRLINDGHIEACQPGASIRVQNARVITRNGFIRVVVDKWGVLKLADSSLNFDVNVKKDVSIVKCE